MGKALHRVLTGRELPDGATLSDCDRSGLGVCPYFMALPSGRWGCWLPTEWGIGKNGQSVAESLEEKGGARADRHAYEASRGFLKRSCRKSYWSTRIDTENQGESCKYRASTRPLAVWEKQRRKWKGKDHVWDAPHPRPSRETGTNQGSREDVPRGFVTLGVEQASFRSLHMSHAFMEGSPRGQHP